MSNRPAPPCFLPPRPSDAHKGHFGRVILIGGSRGMSGSIAMSAMAALKSGSGLVAAAVPDACLETVAAFHPAMTTLPWDDDLTGSFSISAANGLAQPMDSVNAIGLGPGMTTGPGSLRIVDRLLDSHQQARVFDADAINCLAKLDWRDRIQQDASRVVLTPHPGELQRLVGVSPNDRDGQVKAAVELAKQTGVTLVVKGGPTVVVDAEQRYVNTTGNPGMGTGGSGDVLTGILTSFLGQGLAPWDAACLAVWVHGRAGDMAANHHGMAGMTAVEILEFLPNAMQEVSRTNPSASVLPQG